MNSVLKLALLAIIAIAASSFVACGGDDDDAATSASPEPTTSPDTADDDDEATHEPTAIPTADLSDIAEAQLEGEWQMLYEVTDTTGTNVVIQVGDTEDWTWDLESSCGEGGCDHELTTFNEELGEGGPNTLQYSNGSYTYDSPSIIFTNCTVSGGKTIEDSHELSSSINVHVSEAESEGGVLTATALAGTRIVRADATEVGQQNRCSSFTVTYQIGGERSG